VTRKQNILAALLLSAAHISAVVWALMVEQNRTATRGLATSYTPIFSILVFYTPSRFLGKRVKDEERTTRTNTLILLSGAMSERRGNLPA